MGPCLEDSNPDPYGCLLLTVGACTQPPRSCVHGLTCAPLGVLLKSSEFYRLDLSQENAQNFPVFMSLQVKVRETIHKYKMFSPGDRVLVAVSGGPDSTALLHVLNGLKGDLGLHLEAAHLQHGIRGETAREDALFVAGVAERLAVPFHLREVDLPGMRSEKGGGNLEEMGREERYRFFAALAREYNLPRVATGHTRDDQVETLLMWLLRGSGRKGLGGMPPLRRIPAVTDASPEGAVLVRPLIETSRAEVMDFLAAERLDHRIDKTNLDPAPLRNWVRLRLLPQVREKFGAGLDERLAHLAELLRDEEEVLQQLARENLGRVTRGKHLVRDSFLQLGKAMQRRLLRLWLNEAVGDIRGIDFDEVAQLLRFILRGPPQGRLAIPGGWDLVRRYGTVHVRKRGRNRGPVCYSYALPRQGELIIPEAGMKLHCAPVPFSPALTPRGLSEAVFDLALLPDTLTVRNFRHGDRFQPLGMRGHKKLKDLFIEKKVPLEIRSTLPLVLAGEEILWIPGYGRSEIAKVGPGTKGVLKIKLEASRGQSAAEGIILN